MIGLAKSAFEFKDVVREEIAEENDHGREYQTRGNRVLVLQKEFIDPDLDHFMFWCKWNIVPTFIGECNPREVAKHICYGRWFNRTVGPSEARKITF